MGSSGMWTTTGRTSRRGRHATGDPPRRSIGSITDPFSKHYDLITCFEVVEHMPSHDADRAIANLCAFTDEVILTSTPMHYRDPTHTNIHPQEYWTERFARHGFIRDVDYDGAYIAPWAARYRRSSAPIPTPTRK